MKKYVAVCAYTKNERGAEGYASEIKIFDSMEKAKEYISERFEAEKEYSWDKLEFSESNMFDSKTRKQHKGLRASYDDEDFGHCSWKVVEFDI